MHTFLPSDVAERVFNRCVKTNKGKGQSWDDEVHADSRNLEVEFNYEFLEDFKSKQPSDNQLSGEEGPAKENTRYAPSAQIFWSLVAYVLL